MKPFLKIAFNLKRRDLIRFANELFEPLTGDVNQYETPYYPSCTFGLQKTMKEGIDDDPVELTREQQLGLNCFRIGLSER